MEKIFSPDNSIKRTYIMGKNEQTGETFPIMSPGKGKHFSVSFEHLIQEMGLYDADFIEFQVKDLNENGKRILNEVMDKTKSYTNFIDGPKYCKEAILENFHRSLLMSKGFAPIMIDNVHHKLLLESSINNLKMDLSLEVLNRVNKLLKYRIPDFSSMEISKILELRNDSLFQKFREKLFDINNLLTSKDLRDLNESEIESLFLEEYLSEMKEFTISTNDVIINGGLGVVGLIPGLGTVSSVAGLSKTAYDAKKVYDYKKSWIAFIMEY